MGKEQRQNPLGDFSGLMADHYSISLTALFSHPNREEEVCAFDPVSRCWSQPQRETEAGCRICLSQLPRLSDSAKDSHSSPGPSWIPDSHLRPLALSLFRDRVSSHSCLDLQHLLVSSKTSASIYLSQFTRPGL